MSREEFCSVLSSVVEESKATHLSLIKTFDQYARGRHQLHFDEFVSAAAAETQPGLVASFLALAARRTAPRLAGGAVAGEPGGGGVRAA